MEAVPIKGTLDSEMGTASILSDTLFGRTRAAVLSILYGHVGESFYLRQLSRLTGKSLGSVQREVRQLVDAGLVTRKIEVARTLYGANQDCPVFAEIKSLIKKTLGIHDVLYSALESLRRKINLSFVYGFVARSASVMRIARSVLARRSSGSARRRLPCLAAATTLGTVQSGEFCA